jgi:Ca2+-binding EF-hand superfamily protein
MELPPRSSRLFSSPSLLGHSPMAPPPVPSQSSSSHIPIGIVQESSTLIPTVQEALIAGVWQTSTAKRDKLLELRGELAALRIKNATLTTSLDQLATNRQQLDLWMVDGLCLISKVAETTTTTTTTSATTGSPTSSDDAIQDALPWDSLVHGIQDVILKTTSHHTVSPSASPPLSQPDSFLSNDDDQLNQGQWVACLETISHRLQLLAQETLVPPNRCLYAIRDFMDPNDEYNDNRQTNATTAATSNISSRVFSDTLIDTDDSSAVDPPPLYPAANAAAVEQALADSVRRFRVQHTWALVQELQTSWSTWTAVTDQDVDRAAVAPAAAATATAATITEPEASDVRNKMPSLMSRSKLCHAVTAYLCHGSQNRFDALWQLMDKDNDGLLDQSEMDHVCAVTVRVTQVALRRQLVEALDAAPLDQWIELPLQVRTAAGNDTVPPIQSTSGGWRRRRREKQGKRLLNRLMVKTLQHHFADELEMANRMRCIYAWANKAHQNNKVDSILVDASSSSLRRGGVVGGNISTAATTLMGGRQRYVELHPKIALDEFRQVQEIHFPQLNRVGSEFLLGLREELLVHQGQGRQNRELQRDCAIFFTVVCILDYIILSL